MKKTVVIALLGTAIISNIGCKSNSGFKKINGVEYKIVKDAPGKNASVGDIVEMNIRLKADTSESGKGELTVIGDSRRDNNGKPVPMRVEAPQFRGDFKAVFPNLSAGDSAVINIEVDTIIAASHGQRLPSFLKPHRKVIYEVSIVTVQSLDDYKKQMENERAQQGQLDDKVLMDFFAKNNLKPEKTVSGLYYTVTQQGSGDFPKPGQTVSVNYTGKTLDGKVFDSNTDPAFNHTSPFGFVLGNHQVIPGWEEGISLIKTGGKATLYIPSNLAYGPNGNGSSIPANADLIFEVEVLSASDTKDAQQKASLQN